MRIRTALTRMVGIEHPVVQTGMGWWREHGWCRDRECGRPGNPGLGDDDH